MTTRSLAATLLLALGLSGCGGGGEEEVNPIDLIPTFVVRNATPWDASMRFEMSTNFSNVVYVNVPKNATVEVSEATVGPGTWTWSARTDSPGNPCRTTGCDLDGDETIHFIFKDRLVPTHILIDGL